MKRKIRGKYEIIWGKVIESETFASVFDSFVDKYEKEDEHETCDTLDLDDGSENSDKLDQMMIIQFMKVK